MSLNDEPLDASINFRCPQAIKDILIKRAKEDNRSLGNYMVQYLAELLENEHMMLEEKKGDYAKKRSIKKTK